MSEDKNAISIRTENGTVHRITSATMLAALERGEKYLEEAVRYCVEPGTQVKSDAEKEREFSRHKRWLKRNQMPEDVWFPAGNSFNEDNRNSVLLTLEEWVEGTLDSFADVYAALNEDLDLDHTYLLFGVPIRELAVTDQDKLQRLGTRFANRNLAAARH